MRSILEVSSEPMSLSYAFGTRPQQRSNLFFIYYLTKKPKCAAALATDSLYKVARAAPVIRYHFFNYRRPDQAEYTTCQA